VAPGEGGLARQQGHGFAGSEWVETEGRGEEGGVLVVGTAVGVVGGVWLCVCSFGVEVKDILAGGGDAKGKD